MSRRSRCASAAALVIACASTAAAQQWSAELQTGRIRAALDPDADAAHSVAAGIRFEHADAQLRVLGGVPTSTAQPYWGAIAGTKRFALHTGALIAGIDLAAHGFIARDRGEQSQQLPGILGSAPQLTPDASGHAYAAHALPLIGVDLTRIQLQARAGVSHYQRKFGEDQRRRSAAAADVQATIAPSNAFAVVPLLKHARTGDSAYTYAGVTAIAGGQHASLWGSVGQWLDTGADALTWAAGATLRLHSRLALTAGVRGDALDPLYLTPAQTAWNVGVLLHVNRVGVPRAPVPARYVDGRATIRLPTTQAKAAPRIAGDFNNWQPQPMTRSSGAWVYDVALKPGVYNYAFVDEDGEWFVPENYPGRKEDGMGGHVAVLVVQP